MARFRGTVQGNRGEASRLGSALGLETEANGWDVGIRVRASVNEAGQDVFRIAVTGGSHDSIIPAEVLEVTRDADGNFTAEVRGMLRTQLALGSATDAHKIA